MENHKWLLSLLPLENFYLIPKDIKYEYKKDMTITELYNFFVKIVYVWDLVYSYELDILFINLVKKEPIILEMTPKNIQCMTALIIRAKKINLNVVLAEMNNILVLGDWETSFDKYKKNTIIIGYDYFDWNLKISEQEFFNVGRLRMTYNRLFNSLFSQ